MNWLGQALLLSAGLATLLIGADLLLKGAVRAARWLGVRPFIIGVTLVGFGTSAPELTVAIFASARGSTGLALGNVVGSNIANIGLILGIAAVIRPLAIHMRLLKVEIPLMVMVSLLMWGMAADGVVNHFDGMILLIGLGAFGMVLLRSARGESAEVLTEYEQGLPEKQSVIRMTAYIVLGLVGLVIGSKWIVQSATVIARGLGVSDVMIGMTVVAVGTSLPELASSCVAAAKGNTDIAVGNVVGSNLFNILLILGTSALICDMPVPKSVLYVDIPVMLGLSVALIPIGRRGSHILRSEGIGLLFAYAAFLGWLIVLETS